MTVLTFINAIGALIAIIALAGRKYNGMEQEEYNIACTLLVVCGGNAIALLVLA